MTEAKNRKGVKTGPPGKGKASGECGGACVCVSVRKRDGWTDVETDKRIDRQTERDRETEGCGGKKPRWHIAADLSKSPD